MQTIDDELARVEAEYVAEQRLAEERAKEKEKDEEAGDGVAQELVRA